jgi:hypothetical protein
MVSITEIIILSLLVTYAIWFSGSIAMPIYEFPALIESISSINGLYELSFFVYINSNRQKLIFLLSIFKYPKIFASFLIHLFYNVLHSKKIL